MNHRGDRRPGAASGGIHMIPGGRGLGGGVWLTISGLPRDWREMDIFRAMEKRYGKVNQVRRAPGSEREAMVQFVNDPDARFVWHLRELELYDRTCTVDLAKNQGSGGGGGGRGAGRDPDNSPPPMRGSSSGGGFPQSRLGDGVGGMGMRRQFSGNDRGGDWTSAKSTDDRKSRDETKRSNDKGKDSKNRRVPVQESLADFRAKTEPVWKGSVVLKSTVYPIVSHLLKGPISWLNEVLSQGQELQITRRLRLEEEKLKDVTDKMISQESATIICFDAPQKNVTLQPGQHTKPLKHLQAYLLEKEAAGVINANNAIIYIFPSCGFANKIINEDMPTLTLPDKPETVRDEDLGILMVVSAPCDTTASGGGAD